MKYIAILVFALSLTVCATAKNEEKEEPFKVDHNSPKIQAGEIEAQFDKIINITGIRKVKVIVFYYPIEDAVCLQYRIDFMTFNHFFDRDGRAAFLSSLEKYKEDYEQKKLKTKGSKKTRRQYGTVTCYLIWQAAAFTMRAEANMDTDFGYDILEVSKNRAAFFTIYRREAVFIPLQGSQQDRRIATNAPMYLTRNQADELAAFFDQSFLRNLAPDKVFYKSDSTIDEY